MYSLFCSFLHWVVFIDTELPANCFINMNLLLFLCFSEMWWGPSCWVSLLCSWPSDNIPGGPAAHTYQSLWFEWVRVIIMAQDKKKYQRIGPHKHCTVCQHFVFVFWIRKRNFGISYLSRDRSGAEMYLSLLSDWDLDVAFVSSAKPYLQLKMDIKPSEDSKNTYLSLA